MALGLAGHAAHALGLGKPALDYLFENVVYAAIMFGAAAACLARAFARREERGAWACIAVSLTGLATGDAMWDFWLDNLDDPPFPNLADVAYGVFYVAQYAGLVLLLRARLRPFRASLWLDGLIGGLSVAALAAALIFPAVLRATDGNAATVAVTLAYPLGDVLLLCFVVLASALAGWRPGRAWVLIGVGAALSAVADAIYQYLESTAGYPSGTIISSLWPAGSLLVSLAAWQPASARRRNDGGLLTGALAAGFALLALAVLAYGQLVAIPPLAGLLAVAALAAGVARAGLALAENVAMLERSRRQAVTDALSGLSNRRKLMEDLRDLYAEGRECSLAFFDLDGFKQYNDTFGHAAGDALLARVGAALRTALEGSGRAYRLGGDEFCALLDGRRDAGDRVVQAAAGALTERGERFAIGASLGLVGLPSDATSPEQALQLADERMYADKHERRASGPGPLRDVLAQALREHEPSLEAHHRQVAALAAATGRELGCDAETLDVLVRAAELHDLGKVAVPDEILRKPGPLSAPEWELVRQHTLVGERILAAAPALRPVAALVRASHERWDGGGYPDGLAGEEIALGARILAVCDAFDAITSDRPYRPARDAREAMRELERAAGRQFDPVVVAALARARRVSDRCLGSSANLTRTPLPVEHLPG
jgi:diguanylate cyclase (GGDEF)-like protein